MKLSTCALAILTIISLNSFATTATIKPVKPMKLNIADAKPPLNKYGAVDVNTNVPLNVQVPPAVAAKPQAKLATMASQWPNQVPPQPELKLASYILMSAKTGKVLAAYNANKPLPPASLTKLMLMYIVQQQIAAKLIQLDDKFTVPTAAWATGGSRMFLQPKEQVSVRNLISGVLVDSGNDAAVTLATNIAGTQGAFTDMMNQRAKNLGMTNTHFTDIMGLPAPAHYSTAYDMAKLGRAIVSEYPQDLSWYAQKWFSFNGIKQPNFNKLLFIYQYADGLKTGSTKAAGYSLVSTAKMPNNNMRLIGVVMGASSANASATASKALLSYGFRNFTTQTFYPAHKTLTEAKIFMGNKPSFPVGTEQALTLTYPKAIANKIKAKLVLKSPIEAPITKGTSVGSIIVSYKGKTITTAPAYALSSVAKGNIWQRFKSKIALMMHSGNKQKG